jgi:hypothetical protein
MDDPVRGEALKDAVEGRRPDVVKRAEHRDTQQRLPIEDVSAMRTGGVRCKILDRCWSASDDDDAVVGNRLVSEVGAQLLPFGLIGHAESGVEHQVGDELRRLVMERRRDVAVDAEGDGDG